MDSKVIVYVYLNILMIYVNNAAVLRLQVTRKGNGDVFELFGLCMHCTDYGAKASGRDCNLNQCCYRCTCDKSYTLVINERADLVGGVCLKNPVFESQVFQPRCDVFLGYGDTPNSPFAYLSLRFGHIGQLTERGNQGAIPILNKCAAYGAMVYDGNNWRTPILGHANKTTGDFEIQYPYPPSNEKHALGHLYFRGYTKTYAGMIVRVRIICPSKPERCLMFKVLGTHLYPIDTSRKTTPSNRPSTTLGLSTSTFLPSTTEAKDTTTSKPSTVELVATNIYSSEPINTTTAVIVSESSKGGETAMTSGVLILTVVVIILVLAFTIVLVLFIRFRSRYRKRTSDNELETSVNYKSSNGHIGFRKRPVNSKQSTPNGFGSSECIIQEENYDAINDGNNFYSTPNGNNIARLHPIGSGGDGEMTLQLPGQRASLAYEVPTRMRSRSRSA